MFAAVVESDEFWRTQRVLLAVAIALSAAAAGWPRLRSPLLRRPHLALAALVAADLALLLWVTTPFVPDGIDEAQFAVNAHVLRGADLGIAWIRTPLPVVGAALFSWHPVLPGLLLRELAVVCAFLLLRRHLGPGAALLGAFWTAAAGHLASDSCYLLSEPYGAGLLAAFALLATRGRWLPAALVGGLAFCSRWQLGVLLPFAAILGWRRGGKLSGAALSLLLFAAPAALLLPLTGSDPWRSFLHESGRDVALLQRLLAYLEPDVGFGVGLPGLCLLLLGLAAAMRRSRSAELAWCGLLFAAYSAAVLGIGVVTPRFFSPATPLAAVLMVAGAAAAAGRVPLLRRDAPAAVLLAVVSVALALPLRPPKVRHLKHASPQATVLADRSRILAALARAPLYTDYDVFQVTAVLAHPCHAVLWENAHQPSGLDLEWEGKFPSVPRAAIPPGSFYLTVDPAGRPPLWQGGGLSLVLWQ